MKPTIYSTCLSWKENTINCLKIAQHLWNPPFCFFLSRKHSCVCLSLCLSVSSPSPCAGHLLFAKDIGLETRKKSELVKRRWQLKIAYWSEQQSQKPKMISFTLWQRKATNPAHLRRYDQKPLGFFTWKTTQMINTWSMYDVFFRSTNPLID